MANKKEYTPEEVREYNERKQAEIGAQHPVAGHWLVSLVERLS